MESVLKNSKLEVIIDTKGAELVSIKSNKDNTNYLWNADAEYWGRHAPILFPIVGRLKNNQYTLNDKIYNLSQHGFARDNEFTLIESNENSVVYRFTENEDTLKKYPFKFILDVKYVIEDNKISIIYNVKNTNLKEMYFSVGAHPAFNCPINADETMEDYYVEFEKKETAYNYLLGEDGFLSGEKELILNDSNTINLSKELFKNDALVFKNLDSDYVCIKSRKSNKSVKVNFKGFPYLGIWSKPTGAPFVCIEPWLGHTDMSDADGNFKMKDGIIKLAPNKEFSCKYTIEIM